MNLRPNYQMQMVGIASHRVSRVSVAAICRSLKATHRHTLTIGSPSPLFPVMKLWLIAMMVAVSFLNLYLVTHVVVFHSPLKVPPQETVTIMRT